MARSNTSNDINKISSFLAAPDILDILHAAPVDCIVLCVSALICSAEQVFQALIHRADLAKTLVLCGGIGHSTNFLYEAIDKSKYAHLRSKVQGKPEAQVMHLVLTEFLDSRQTTLSNVQVLLEDKSTNCGANASETRNILDANGVKPTSFLIVQDPTMMRRTLASFRKTYSDIVDAPIFSGCPTFVPRVSGDIGKMHHSSAFPSDELWEMNRFLALLLGEVPRLRNDKDGYGPKGKGFIVAVDIPAEVEESWSRLAESSIGELTSSRNTT